MISRRGFTKSAPMAVTAGGVALGSGGGMNVAKEPGRLLGPMISGDAAVEDTLSGPRRIFRELMRDKVNPMQYQQLRRNWQSMNPNITALKSVSDQHKVHMMFEDHKRIEETRKNWLIGFAKIAGLPVDDWELRDRF